MKGVFLPALLVFFCLIAQFFTAAGQGSGALPIAHDHPKFLGNIYSTSQIKGFTHYWNQVTPENAGKWGTVERSRDDMNWKELDAAYALAKDNGFPFRLHVLVWGNQQPSWIENLPAAEQLVEINEWFAALANRYPGIDFVEVVNEPLHDPPNSTGNGGGNYIRALGGAGTTGWDWVLEAFRLARRYFPHSKLAINEYDIVNNATNTGNYLTLINLLKRESLIDQIGVQAHAFSTRGSVEEIRQNLDLLATTGLPLYITELDIDGLTDQIQLADYQRIFPVFWEHPAVRGITLWGFRPGQWRTPQKAYLIEPDGVTERPALQWLRTYVAGTLVETPRHVPRTDRVSVFPNPVRSGEFSVEGIDEIRLVEVFDQSGRMIWSLAPGGNVIRLDASVTSGLYVLKLYDKHFVYTQKIFVSR